MADLVKVEIDQELLKYAVNEAEGLEALLWEQVKEIRDKANAFGAGFETERTIVWATGEHVGGNSPEYKAAIQKGNRGPVGIVVTGNYSAMKDNYLHNTLLKAKG